MKTYKERTESILQKAEVKRQQKRKRITLISVLASVAAAILAFNLVLFVPYTVGGTDLTKYSSSEYYGVIQQLYGLTHKVTAPRRTNNFNEWFGGIFKAGASLWGGYGSSQPDGASGSLPPMPTSPGPSDGNPAFSNTDHSNSYIETTLNQTDGVIEGDLFKRSDTHIFYLDYVWSGGNLEYNLRVYTIAGEDSTLVTEYKIKPDDDTSFGYISQREMYLSKDLSTITVISPCRDYNNSPSAFIYDSYTTVINLDVSDLSNVTEKGRTYISGKYVSSRITDDNLLVISDFNVRSNADFDNLSAYVPRVGQKDNMTPIAAKDIVCPQNADAARYTVICSLGNDLDVKDSVALLSFSDDVYVSQNNLFATRTYNATVKINDYYYTHDMTEIRIVPYDDGMFGDTRAVTANGTVLNRYSLDEEGGILRAFTTVNYVENIKSKCMLYCYDLDTLEIAAKVENFAPRGESVKSARFYGDTAYVCTAVTRIVITDPVFAFDLSDLNDIKYTDTGTIPGYSLSLNKFAHNTLLGIGYGDDTRTLKIELYEQTDSNVQSVAKYEERDVSFSREFKAHLIDAKNGIVGLGISKLMQDGTRYAIFLYDGYDITEIASVEMSSPYDNDYMRATVIDGYVYIFAQGDFHVIKSA